MRRLLFIIIGLLSLAACKTDKTSVPQEFECFNQPHIYIKYKQPINGYTVKVMWLQYGEVGNALFCLEKQGVQYYYFAEKWTDKILYDKGNTYPHNTVIELDYTAKLKSEEYLSDDSPFFFSDVDFDGEEEFIINRYKSGSRDSNAYDVYDVSPYGYFIQKTEVPFTELENGQCKFDSENKTITVFGSNGWNNAIRHIYQLKDRKFELVMCVNFASCSSDNDEESNGGKSTQELLQGVWYDAYTDDCPYFIVEKGYCYFANQPSTVYYVEKYKYTFDSKNNTLMCYGYDEESDTYDNEPWYIRVKSVSDTKLIIKLLNDDNQTVDDTRDCVKQ